MLPSLANLGCDTQTPKRKRSERRTPILVDGEWVHHYRHAPLDDASIRRAVHVLFRSARDVARYATVIEEYGPVFEWDVSVVADFSSLFEYVASFNSDLSGWDVGKAKRMNFMFGGATSFNSDLSAWNVGNVESMAGMFGGAESFTSDLSRWDVGNVSNMGGMFGGATSFTSDLSTWNVGNGARTRRVGHGAERGERAGAREEGGEDSHTREQ